MFEEGYLNFLITSLTFIIVLFAVYLILTKTKIFPFKKGKELNLQDIVFFGRDKGIAVVKFRNKKLLVGFGEKGVEILKELEDDSNIPSHSDRISKSRNS